MPKLVDIIHVIYDSDGTQVDWYYSQASAESEVERLLADYDEDYPPPVSYKIVREEMRNY